MMKDILCLILCCCFIETTFAMKQKELSKIQLTEKQAISRLIEDQFVTPQTQLECLNSISTLITRLQESGDQSGAAVLTLAHLESVVCVVNKLREYREEPSSARKNDLLSIANSYGNSISELIHVVID